VLVVVCEVSLVVVVGMLLWVELRADSPDLTIGGFQGMWTGGVLGVGVMAVKVPFFRLFFDF
jgi:hypothetical protein